MVECVGLKIITLRSPLPTKFYENLKTGSKVIRRGHTHRQAGDLISFLSIFGM
jgi:hypothetical protein